MRPGSLPGRGTADMGDPLPAAGRADPEPRQHAAGEDRRSAFRQQLLAAIPKLRAFSPSLAAHADHAADVTTAGGQEGQLDMADLRVVQQRRQLDDTPVRDLDGIMVGMGIVEVHCGRVPAWSRPCHGPGGP